MECSVCAYEIHGEPAAKFLIEGKENGDPVVLLAMRVCDRPLCHPAAAAVYSAVMELTRGNQATVVIQMP